MTHAAPAPKAEPLRPLLARIWRDYLRARRGKLFLSMLAAAVTAGTTALIFRLLEPAINGLFIEQSERALLLIPAAIVGASLVRAVASIAQANLVNRLGHGVVGEIQTQLFGRMIRADLARLRSQHSGGYVSSVLFDANLVREAFTSGAVTYVQHSLTLVAMLASMLWIDASLTLVVLLGIPLITLIMRQFSRRSRKAAVGAMAETENLSTALMENLDGVRVIKIENRETAEEARVAEVVGRRQRFIIKGANARAFAGPLSEFISTIVVALVLLFAGWQARQGGMNVGEFAAFVGLLLGAGQSLRQVTNLQTVMVEGLTAARRLFTALDIEPEIREVDAPLPLARGPVTVALEDVSFAYSTTTEDAPPTLSDVSIVVRPGETVALVGPSGGGKSTILSLLPRFYDVTVGAVTVNGHDIRRLSLHDLRESIALVTQEPFLFDDTIAANIAYGRSGASAEDIVEAARAAAAHDFIAALPEGYATRVGEAGMRLSGGQRQRIAIARAFLKDAPILLLDEATSALDTESEALVQAALERLMEGRATLLIAHRLSTVQNADRIYVVEAGRVVEEGSHAALVRKGGLYSRLAKQQALGGTPEPTVETVA